MLTFNPGSSSVKLGVFTVEDGRPQLIGRASVSMGPRTSALRIDDADRAIDLPAAGDALPAFHTQIDPIARHLFRHFAIDRLRAVAHRVVHGGDRFTGPTLIDATVRAGIEALAPLAPLHQPQSLRNITAVRHLWPDLPQVASFDTAFHRTQSDRVRRFALPRVLFDDGIKRYGFHGLSFQSIAGQLQERHPALHAGRVVVAHLGSGASVCGLVGGESRDTSMAFSTLDGVPMATRPGAVDPGVLLYLQKERGMTLDALEDMLYHRSGLLGLSGISGDARVLAASAAPEAREALASMTLRIAREIAAIATTLGGLDAIVFTGGIGEHQPDIRNAICLHLGWLGVQADPLAPAVPPARIDVAGSKVPLLVLHTDEEQVLAEEACQVHPHPPSGTPR
ncbi:MAG: acetate/propionate family kinase [Variovorax sp.]|nr:MAG: acetate/propionate family kinase [Variovorax sp.]